MDIIQTAVNSIYFFTRRHAPRTFKKIEQKIVE